MPRKTPSPSRQEARSRILHRISRIEGQLQGIRRMIEQENQCLDVLTQIMAVRSATSMLGLELLKEDLLCRSKDQTGVSEKYLKALFNLN